MKKLRHLFGGLAMTWPRVLLFAVGTAVVTAGLNLIPCLKDTSFTDIAVTFECWIVFALIVITNCRGRWEAALKCFVFFLVSQPLIYLIEVPFNPLGWGLFGYYRYWFILTVLTLPGAAVAYEVTKKRVSSVIVLSVANAYLVYAAVDFMSTAIWNGGRHCISSLFCLALAVLFTVIFFDEDCKKLRLAAFAVAAVFLAVSIAVGIVQTGTGRAYIDLGEPSAGQSWQIEQADDGAVVVTEDTPGHMCVRARRQGTATVIFTDGSGETRTYYISVIKRNVSFQLAE